jgi:hypothetical protein
MVDLPECKREAMPPSSPAPDAVGAPSGGAVEAAAVVLEPTRRGRDELEQPRFGLRGHQRLLLAQLDGRRSLGNCADADPRLQPVRLARDAARLVAFGLARQVHGELPPKLMVEAMDLTARIPLDQLPPLEPERTVNPMQPRVATTRSRHMPPRDEESAAPQEPERPRWPMAWLAAMVALAIAAIGYLA